MEYTQDFRAAPDRGYSDEQLRVARIGLQKARNGFFELSELEKRISRQAGSRLSKVLFDGVESMNDFMALDEAQEIATLTGHYIPSYLNIPMGRLTELPEEIYLPIVRALLDSEEMVGGPIR